MGDITAKTWYNMSAEIPLAVEAKAYTGREKTRRALIFAGNRFNLYGKSDDPYARCDKAVEYAPLELPGGLVLPVALVSETYRESEPQAAQLDAESAASVLESNLIRKLREEVGDGTIVTHGFERTVRDGVLTVRMTAECVEQIAVTVEIPGETMAALGAEK